jgi:hypothetical protein
MVSLHPAAHRRVHAHAATLRTDRGDHRPTAPPTVLAAHNAESARVADRRSPGEGEYRTSVQAWSPATGPPSLHLPDLSASDLAVLRAADYESADRLRDDFGLNCKGPKFRKGSSPGPRALGLPAGSVRRRRHVRWLACRYLPFLAGVREACVPQFALYRKLPLPSS